MSAGGGDAPSPLESACAPPRTWRHLSIACAITVGFLIDVPLAAEGTNPDSNAARIGTALVEGGLPDATQRELAERFAPVLVFHPREEYFPVNPLFPIDLAPAGTAGTRAAAADLIGTSVSRREQYRLLTPVEKAELATVYYRAYPARRGGGEVVVLEYWLYYVENAYRVRGGLLPLWVDSSHPNDLEHIHIVLRASQEGVLVPEEVWASSHEGVVPANRYRFGPGTDRSPERGRFLVERGSHAMAPDVNEDNLFTPGIDGHSGSRMLWGVRDHGIASTGYRPSYLDPHRESASIVFAYADPAGADARLTYRLAPVDDIGGAFAELALTARERRERFEVPRHWLRRVFGADNGSSDKLLVPPPPDEGGTSIGIGHIAATERGFLVGGTFKFQDQGVLLGARYAHLHGVPYLPDLVVEVDAIRTSKYGYLTTQFLFSYPLDASLKVMAGRALVTDSWRFDNRQWDWYAGAELTLGPMRISAASRSLGPITNLSKEFRLAYFF